MDKRTIKKASVSEIEAAFTELAISRISLYLDEPTKSNNRKMDLLDAMGAQLLKFGEQGIDAVRRLSVHPDPQVRVSIAPTLIVLNRDEGRRMLSELRSDLNLKVGLVARMFLDFDEYL